MSRKSVFVALALVLLLAGGVSSVLALLVRHEPAAYRMSAPDPGEGRKIQSAKCKAELFGQLIDGVLNKRDWGAQFTEDMINSYFEEDFILSGSGEKLLPNGVSEPRVTIKPDTLRLSFRYGTGSWNTVVSIDLSVWLAAKEPNVVVLELRGFRAGSLPISAQSLLERVSEAARQQNLEVTWYRHHGNPVAVVRFQPYQSRPTFLLQRLELGEGTLRIGGRSFDAPVAPTEPLAARTGED